MLTALAPTVVSAEKPQDVWVSPNEREEHAPDPNDPKRTHDGGFMFGGVRYDNPGWLDGSIAQVPKRMEREI